MQTGYALKSPVQRYEDFRLNPASPLMPNLAFAGLMPGSSIGSRKLQDMSPFDNHGDLMSGLTPNNFSFDPTIQRWAVRGYAGTNDYITIPARNHPWDGRCFVLSLWFKATAWSGDAFQGLWGQGYAYPNFAFELHYDKGNAEIRLIVSIAGTPYLCFANYKIRPSQGTWHHMMVGRIMPTQALLILDGRSEWTTTITDGGILSASTEAQYLFRLRGDYKGHFDGWLADGLRWNGPMSVQQVRTIARELANPQNVDLRVGGVPLLLPAQRKLWGVPTLPSEISEGYGVLSGTANLTASGQTIRRGAGSVGASSAVSGRARTTNYGQAAAAAISSVQAACVVSRKGHVTLSGQGVTTAVASKAIPCGHAQAITIGSGQAAAICSRIGSAGLNAQSTMAVAAVQLASCRKASISAISTMQAKATCIRAGRAELVGQSDLSILGLTPAAHALPGFIGEIRLIAMPGQVSTQASITGTILTRPT